MIRKLLKENIYLILFAGILYGTNFGVLKLLSTRSFTMMLSLYVSHGLLFSLHFILFNILVFLKKFKPNSLTNFILISVSIKFLVMIVASYLISENLPSQKNTIIANMFMTYFIYLFYFIKRGLRIIKKTTS